MPTYKLTKVGKMGDFDEKWGQTYWGETESGDNVMFNSKTKYVPNGATVKSEEATEKTAKNGKKYYRLAKTVVDTNNAPQPSEGTPGADYAKLMQKTIRIEKTVNEILEIVKTGTSSSDDDEPVDLSDIPF